MTTPERPTPGMEPAEGRDDLGIPGADREPDPGGPESPQTPPLPRTPPAGRETERRDDLADRVGSGGQGGAGADRPDLITGTDVPEGQM